MHEIEYLKKLKEGENKKKKIVTEVKINKRAFNKWENNDTYLLNESEQEDEINSCTITNCKENEVSHFKSQF